MGLNELFSHAPEFYLSEALSMDSKKNEYSDIVALESWIDLVKKVLEKKKNAMKYTTFLPYVRFATTKINFLKI